MGQLPLREAGSGEGQKLSDALPRHRKRTVTFRPGLLRPQEQHVKDVIGNRDAFQPEREFDKQKTGGAVTFLRALRRQVDEVPELAVSRRV